MSEFRVVWMVVGAFRVALPGEPSSDIPGGAVTLGTFLATLKCFQQVGEELQEIYVEILDIQRTIGPLRRITMHMNLKTDLLERLRLHEERLINGARRREEARRSNSGAVQGVIRNTRGVITNFAVDMVDIEIKKLSFRVNEATTGAAVLAAGPRQRATVLLRQMSARFRQGKLYAFVGAPRSGKGTLLRLLGEVVLPRKEDGVVMIPPHLRALHLSQSASLLDEDLLQMCCSSQTCQRLEASIESCAYAREQDSVNTCLDNSKSLNPPRCGLLS
jgi:ABC-type multidrug transport system fused ATPase/permease subunit